MAEQQNSDDRDDSLPVPHLRASDVYGPKANRKDVDELSERVERLTGELEELRKSGATGVKPTYSVKEAARLLGKSEQTIRRWIREGKLESTKSSDVQQGHHLIPYSSLAEYLSG
jgi:excisionase family DNA binding protein